MSAVEIDSLAAYARVLDALPIVSWMSDIDGNVTYVSPSWERLTGNRATDILGAGYAAFVHPEDVAGVISLWENARTRAAPYRDEFRVRCSDGSFRWMQSEADIVRSNRGDALGWLGTVTDTHDRRIAQDVIARREALLAESEKRHRLTAQSIPGTTWTASPDGELDRILDGSFALPRRPADTRLGNAWLDGVHDGDRAHAAERWRRSISTGEPYESTFRVRIADGTYRWHLVRALPQRDEADGRIVRWVGLGIDIDDRVRADGEREKFVALAENSSDIVAIADRAGTIVYANPATLALLEARRDEIVGKPFLAAIHPADVPFVVSDVLPGVERDRRWLGEYRFRNFRTGRALPVKANVFDIVDSVGTRTGYATIGRDLREQQRFEIGLRALADAGRAMHESLDFEATMQNIVTAIVADFAHHCSVEIVDPAGEIRSVSFAARDAAEIPMARAAIATRNASLPEGHPIRRAIAYGESTLKNSLEPTFLRSTGLDAFIGEQRGLIDLSSVIYVPVRSPHDGRIHGSLSVGLAASDARARYTDDDVRFAEELGTRAGLAFDNARAYERTRRVAVEMQAASLPAFLPRTSALELHAEYRPAADEATIGGDWYDAFILPDGRVAMTIGDVVGHGLKAAIWMTKLRQSLQAAALLDANPRVMLGVADRTLGMLEADVYATALVAIYDPRTRELTVASAGHPAPVLVRSDGAISEIACEGTMLGVAARAPYGSAAIELRAGDFLAFYTDGLIEAERDLDRGRDRLRQALAREAVRSAANPALAIYESCISGTTIRDDIAILTACVL